MNSISEKNQKFILEGLNLLSSLDDLRECEKEIFNYIKSYKEGSLIDKTELFKVIDEAEYFKVKTNDIVSTVNLHISKVEYGEEDVENNLTSVSKNAYIGNITLPTNIVTTDFLPDFTVTVVNLGLDGISKDVDELYLKLFYPDLTEFSEITVPINGNISKLMDSIDIEVKRMQSPGRNYQYNLSIQVRNKESLDVFGSLEIRGINISKEADSIHVIQETYERL